MYSDHQQQQPRSTETQPTKDTRDSPWSDLRLSVPNTRSGESVVAFVECVLVELTHENVGAEFVSTSVAGMKRTQFIAVDDVGQRLQKRYFDELLGWHETTVSRETVRDELVTRLSRSFSDRTDETPDAEPDTFRVKPLHQF